MSSHRQHWIMAGASGALLVACTMSLLEEAPIVPGRAASFPHAVHLGADVELECLDCHVTAEDEDAAGMPSLALCGNCHDEDTDAGKPVERTPAGFILAGETKPTWSAVTKAAIPVTFSHARHVAAELACEQCHAGLAESQAVDRSLALTMQDCIDCHQDLEVADGGCAGCHPGVDTRWAPGNHDASWIHSHGLFSGFAGGAPAGNCALCHSESDCASCHASTTPVDHTEPWRARGHGFAAMIDRERCLLCHQEDSCVRCHRQATPASHTALWGGRTGAHCASCHLPLGADDNCISCHADTRSHRSAPRIPGAPHPGPKADCRECHFPLRHFDNGQACTFCHR